jgi:nucleoside-diphosphate-sugar epimerase
MILVTGGTGVMGGLLVQRLCDAGHAVRVLTLPDDPMVSRVEKPGVEIRYGDISVASEVSGICKNIDTVYHCAAVIVTGDASLFTTININGTRNLITDAKKEGVKHFIYISSASVLYPKPTSYSLSKKQGEHIVATSGVPYTIIRPTLVYDKGKGGLEFDMYLAYLRRFPVAPFIGAGGALKRPVYAGDVIQGLVAVCNNLKTMQKIYNFSGGEAISIRDFSRLCLKLLGNPDKLIVSLPVWFCKSLAAVMQIVMRNPPLNWQKIAGITQDADLDPAEAMEDLGYNPKKVTEFLKECFPRI